MSRAKSAAHLELISLVVERLLAEKLDDALSCAFDLTGYVSNYTPTAAREFGAVLVAIAGVVDSTRRKDIVHAVVFYYEMNSKRGSRNWVKADALADYAMREPETVYADWRRGSDKKTIGRAA